MKKNIAIFIIPLLILSCQKSIDLYLGVPLQPKFEENSFVPGLNIFGIIRPDFTDGHNKSFVVIQQVVSAVDTSDFILPDTADVVITNEKNTLNHTFIITNFNNIFDDENYRPEDSFYPSVGSVYSINCIYKDLPVLTASTILPNPPTIDSISVSYYKNKLSFDILPDSSIFMLDIYLYINNLPHNNIRLPAEMDYSTSVIFENVPDTKIDIEVYGYDYNIAKYYLSSNTSLNFNKYRESYSIVNNGYGVFGSLNSTKYQVKQ